MTARIVIVYGPKGSGKTRNAMRLRDHFGCTRIVDTGSEPARRHHLRPGDLVLTCEGDEAELAARARARPRGNHRPAQLDVLVIHIGEALKLSQDEASAAKELMSGQRDVFRAPYSHRPATHMVFTPRPRTSIDWMAVAGHDNGAGKELQIRPTQGATAPDDEGDWSVTEPFLECSANVCTPPRDEPDTGPSATAVVFWPMAGLLAIVGMVVWALSSFAAR